MRPEETHIEEARDQKRQKLRKRKYLAKNEERAEDRNPKLVSDSKDANERRSISELISMKTKQNTKRGSHTRTNERGTSRREKQR